MISASVQFSHSVVSDSLWPHGLQHFRRRCLSPTPGAYSNSRPTGWWWHPTMSSSVVPFSSCLQSFQESGSFPVSQFFASGDQSIRISASEASVFPMNIQDWFPLGWTGLCVLICCLDWSLLFFQGTKSFNFMAAVTICSDFGDQKIKVSHCFHCFRIYLPWSDGTGCNDLSSLNVEL